MRLEGLPADRCGYPQGRSGDGRDTTGDITVVTQSRVKRTRRPYPQKSKYATPYPTAATVTVAVPVTMVPSASIGLVNG